MLSKLYWWYDFQTWYEIDLCTFEGADPTNPMHGFMSWSVRPSV